MLSKKQIVVGISSIIIFILFVVYTRAYTRFVMRYALIPLGIMNLPDYLGVTIAVIVISALPATMFIWSWRYLFARREPIPSSLDRFRKQITELDNARANLSNAIEYLNDMKGEISANYQKQEELNAIVKKLESVSKESAEELRTKLEAIGIVTKWKEVNKLLIGFLLGILASLIATAIWSVILQMIYTSGEQP